MYLCIFYIRFRLYLFPLSLSLSLLSLSCFSLLLFPTLRMVPPRRLGPAQGFFLLNGSFSLTVCLPGCSGSEFLTI